MTLEERLAPVKRDGRIIRKRYRLSKNKIEAAREVMKFIENIIGVRIYDLLAKDDEQQGGSAGEEKAKRRRLILVRHGETQRHEERVFMGQYDVPLDAEGKEQCTIVGLELQHFDIDTDKIYTSDLMRAVESSEIIAGFLPSRPEVVALPELRRCLWGLGTGNLSREIRETYPEEYAARGENLLTYKIDDEAENFVQLQERVMKKVNEIIRSAEGDVLIVGAFRRQPGHHVQSDGKRAERYLPHRIRQRNVSDYGAVTAKTGGSLPKAGGRSVKIRNSRRRF